MKTVHIPQPEPSVAGFTLEELDVNELRTAYHDARILAATARAQILTIELGGPSAPVAADAWLRVAQLESAR